MEVVNKKPKDKDGDLHPGDRDVFEKAGIVRIIYLGKLAGCVFHNPGIPHEPCWEITRADSQAETNKPRWARWIKRSNP